VKRSSLDVACTCTPCPLVVPSTLSPKYAVNAPAPLAPSALTVTPSPMVA
jgi:hypothetical protein